MTDNALPPGLAFDSNMLGKQTPRRFMALWMEVAQSKVLIMPRVMDELRAPNAIDLSPTAQRRNELHRRCWDAIVRKPGTPYAAVEMSDEQHESARELMQRFTLRCFPRLNDPSQIMRYSDALIIAQALAVGVDCVVTNNMRSVDHYEINDLVAKRMGRNVGIVLDADRAVMQAHSGSESSRRLLATALASNWPESGEPLTLQQAHEYATDLSARLAGGLNMPMVADRLLSAFDVDEDLEALLEHARELSRSSRTVECERYRARVLRRDAQTTGIIESGYGL